MVPFRRYQESSGLTGSRGEYLGLLEFVADFAGGPTSLVFVSASKYILPVASDIPPLPDAVKSCRSIHGHQTGVEWAACGTVWSRSK